MKSLPEKHKLSADRPIQSANDDLLGRTDFALSLAKTIQGWKGNDSLVIGLCGNWGSGKTSLKNMTLETLRSSYVDHPEIVEFNPWQWAGQHALFESFFREIAVALGKLDKTGVGKKRALKWQYYGALIKTGSVVFSGLSSVIPWLLVLASALGVSLAFIETPLYRNLILIFLIICSIGTAFFKFAGKFSENIANIFAFRAQLSKKGLATLKSELMTDLEKMSKTVLVVIDDIDRLTADETRILIQLVKANADFPNIVYLLIFQRDIVEKNLKSNKISGKDYLEKIIQVHFDIPSIDKGRIEKVLFSELDKILEEDEKVLKRFDQTRWGNVFYVGIRPYFETLRNVYRYLSTLSFHVNLFKGDKAFEVNPIDLIVLEVLRLFEPEVYMGIAQSKDIFAHISRRNERGEEINKKLQSIFERASNGRKDNVIEIIRQLFPNIEWAMDGPEYGGDFVEEWYQDLRVCHPDVFTKYFQLAIPESDISQSELEVIIEKTKDKNELLKEFISLRERELLDVALNRLDAYKQKIPLGNALAFVPALLEISDTLKRGSSGFFDFGPFTHAERILYWYLRQENDSQKRGDILFDSLNSSEGISLVGSLLRSEEQRREKKRDPKDFLLSDQQFERVKDLFIKKIKQIDPLNHEKLANNEQLIGILYSWRRWGSKDEAKNWVNEFTKSKIGLLLFLKRLMNMTTSQTVGDHIYEQRHYIDLKNVEDFLSIDVVKRRLSSINRNDIGNDENQAIEAFEKAVLRRVEGRSADDFWDDD